MAGTENERAEAAERFADRRIFVSVVAFGGDDDVVGTVRHALEAADRPARLRFGICHLYDETATDADLFGDDPRVVLDRVPIHEGGPLGWARARTQAHFDSERYFLQIDAPMRFVDGWDRRMIDQLETTGSARPILADPQWPGLLFAHGRFVIDVPADPQLTADVDELTTTIRAYTHGYDASRPDDHVVDRVDGARAPRDGAVDPAARLAALGRAERLLGGDDRGFGRFGLGRLRTIAAHEHLTGRRLLAELASSRPERH